MKAVTIETSGNGVSAPRRLGNRCTAASVAVSNYTPLFKFLLSKRGQPWDAVHDEASKCCTHTFNGVPFTRPFEDLGKLPRAGEDAV